MVAPSGLMATLETALVCPCRVALHSPDSRSHTLRMWELESAWRAYCRMASPRALNPTGSCCRQILTRWWRRRG